jgi:hypothetical protein
MQVCRALPEFARDSGESLPFLQRNPAPALPERVFALTGGLL